jgi:hypothetical protein
VNSLKKLENCIKIFLEIQEFFEIHVKFWCSASVKIKKNCPRVPSQFQNFSMEIPEFLDGNTGIFGVRPRCKCKQQQVNIKIISPQIVNRGRNFRARGSLFSCRSEAKQRPIWTQVPQKPAKVDAR